MTEMLPYAWDTRGGLLSITFIPDISTTLTRPRRPKQYCLQLLVYKNPAFKSCEALTCIFLFLFLFSPVQLNPSPTNPCLQWQLYDPMVLLQIASLSQGLVCSFSHSLTSVKMLKEYSINNTTKAKLL